MDHHYQSLQWCCQTKHLHCKQKMFQDVVNMLDPT